MKLTKLFTEFFESEQASGVILIACTMLSIAIANSPWGTAYVELWHHKLGLVWGSFEFKLSLEHWINDGLMTIFFLLIGLEIEREIYIGELSNLKNASLPILAAIGGMTLPALFHFLLNQGSATQNGMGIPMATDIAFALGVLALLSSHIPASLKVFLASLAIIDDLGAIIVIALFYTENISWLYLGSALGIYAGLLILNHLRVHGLPFYLVPGILMWYFMMMSGVHATLSGVLLAFALPFLDGSESSPSFRLQHVLHKPVAFLIVPLFALANTGITLGLGWAASLATQNSLGIFSGLFFGKPIGILLVCLLAVRSGISQLPTGLTWRHMLGAGFLGGIGFTMSIFITLLAFDSTAIIQNTKITILLTSMLAGTTGFLILRSTATIQSME